MVQIVNKDLNLYIIGISLADFGIFFFKLNLQDRCSTFGFGENSKTPRTETIVWGGLIC